MKRIITLYILVFTVLASWVGVAQADQLKLGKMWYRDVRIIGLHEGRLYYGYKNKSGEQAVELAKVTDLRLTRFPNLEKAEQAIDAKQFAKAAQIFKDVASRAKKDYVKILIGAKVVVCLDRSDQYEQALIEYLKLLQLDTGDLAKAAAPRRLPKEPAKRARISKIIKQQIQVIAEPVAHDFLARTLKALEGNSSAAPAASSSTAATGGGLAILQGEAEAQKDVVAELIKNKKFAKALAIIEKKMTSGSRSLSTLLYRRGVCLMALGREKDAALSFMRVIIHFRPTTTDRYVPCLIEAGKYFQKNKKNAHAKKLWEQAKRHSRDSKQTEQVQRLLDSIKP